jgi:hypothetical protein
MGVILRRFACKPHGLHLRDVDPLVVHFDALAPGAANEHGVTGRALVEVAVLSHGEALNEPTTAGPAGEGGYLKMLTARAATSRIVSAETADSESIMSFVRRVSGIASVGLNATELVKDT